MLALWILNILDLAVATILIGVHFGFFIAAIVPTIMYLIIKGLILIKDPFSIIDIMIAIYLIILAFGIKTFLTWIFVIYLLYKTIISLKT